VCKVQIFAGDCDAENVFSVQATERCNIINDIRLDIGKGDNCVDGSPPAGWLLNVNDPGHSYTMANGDLAVHYGGSSYDSYVLSQASGYPPGRIGWGECDATVYNAHALMCMAGGGNNRCSIACDRVQQNGVFVGVCQGYGTPLIINFDGRGLALSGPERGVRFDLLATGAAQKTGWVAKPASDMFLVRDVDGDGAIEGGAELFGNRTMGPDGKTSANGFDALAKFDENRDGVIDAQDPVWAELRLWSDADGDGRTRSGELRSLASMKVAAIRLAYTTGAEVDAFGNQLRQTSSVVLEGGDTRSITDVWFRLGN
jgi:hypothetical protein